MDAQIKADLKALWSPMWRIALGFLYLTGTLFFLAESGPRPVPDPLNRDMEQVSP
jgi:hypothetical protein